MGRPASGHATTRQRILQITRDAIAERGVERVALTDVAAAADLTVPTLYHYFRDRQDLILAVLDAEVSELLAAVQVSDAFADSPETRVRVFLEKEADYLAATRPPTLALVLRALLGSEDDPLRATAATALGHAAGLFGDVVAQLEPERTPAEARVLTDLLRACLAGVFLMRAIDADIDVGAVAARLLAGLELQDQSDLDRSTRG
jgi:TetR/AcrR family transcriptional regulator